MFFRLSFQAFRVNLICWESLREFLQIWHKHPLGLKDRLNIGCRRNSILNVLIMTNITKMSNVSIKEG